MRNLSRQDVRQTQTKTKHRILSDYLDAWAGIILFGIKARWKGRRTVTRPHFVYVDCFSFKGRYEGGDLDEPEHQTVYGSPVIGIRALDKFAKFARKQDVFVSTNVILIEKDPKHYRALQETLMETGYESRVRETTNFASLRNGEITIVNQDATTLGDDLLRYTDAPHTWAFYLIDPWGASGIPYPFVQKIVSAPRHDVMINFIYEDFLRKTGMVDSDFDTQQSLVDYWRAAFGGQIWEELILPTVREIEASPHSRSILDKIPLLSEDEKGLLADQPSAILKERLFVLGYVHTLKSMDVDIAVKPIALRFPDKERTMLYLFLTTHDVTGALKMNEVLFKAKLLEHELRYKARITKIRKTGQIPLFDISSGGAKKTSRERPDIKDVADEMFKIFQGQKTTRKKVYQAFVTTDLFPREIDRALALLKKRGDVQYDGKMTHRTWLQFRQR